MRVCALYRLYDSRGRLLYVGCSGEPKLRRRAHSYNRIWGADIASMTVKWFDSKGAALTAERHACVFEAPKWNRMYGGPHFATKIARDYRRIVALDAAGCPRSDIARMFNTTTATISNRLRWMRERLAHKTA